MMSDAAKEEIIKDAAKRIFANDLDNPTQLRKDYRLSYVTSQYIWLEAKVSASWFGLDLFPPPNHENGLKEWMR